MSISKKVMYISPSIVDGSEDSIRAELGAHWVTTDLSTKNSSKKRMTYLLKDKNARKRENIVDFSLTEEVADDNLRLPVKNLAIRIYGNPRKFENQTHWQAFVRGQTYAGTTFQNLFKSDLIQDHSFICEQPFTERQANELGGNTRIKTSDVKMEYNYYQYEYETMQQNVIDEKILPNLYALYSLKEEDALTARNEIFRRHVTLAGALTVNEAAKFNDKGRKNDKSSNSLEYLKSYAKAMTRTRSEGLQDVRERYNNMMLTPTSTSLLLYNNKKFMFPMWGEITFATDVTTQFTQLLQDCDSSGIFMKDLYGSTIGKHPWTYVEQNFTTHTTVPVEIKNEAGRTKIKNTISAGSATMKVWNVEDWYRSFQSTNPSTMNSGIFMGQENKEITMATAKNHGFYKKMLETIFIGKLRTLVKSQQRKFSEIIDGDGCYSEELFYKIEKYAGDPSGTPIQTFWLANTNNIDVYNFIDTQVKYGERYSYKATVYNFVIGAQYRYTKIAVTQRITEDCVEFVDGANNPVAPRVKGHVLVNNISGTRTAIQVPKDQRFMAEANVQVIPRVFITETPFFTHQSRLIDDPPLAPEIDILPYRTDSRFLKFFMQGCGGELKMDPIIITAEDQTMVTSIRRAKNLRSDDPITYASDDYPSFFQIYRMEKPPRRYQDFREHLRKTLATDVSEETRQKAASAAYVDQLRSNRKYYYMFRSIDVHGKIGAPSPVYEVEIVYDKGAFYHLMKIYNMDSTPDVTNVKTGRRFIQIIPNIDQTLINEDKSDFDSFNSAKDLKSLTYGYGDESIWTKKFKIRLTSKKTGKKVDINLRFKTKRVKTDLEESS